MTNGPTISVHLAPGSAISCFGLKICANCEGFARELQNRVRRIFILACDPEYKRLFSWHRRRRMAKVILHKNKGSNHADFDNSHWSDSNFAQDYRHQADGYIPERHSLIEITKSFFRHMVRGSQPRRILDLGCGDGLMVQELLKVDDTIDATLVDGSTEMLKAAGKRLACFKKCIGLMQASKTCFRRTRCKTLLILFYPLWQFIILPWRKRSLCLNTFIAIWNLMAFPEHRRGSFAER